MILRPALTIQSAAEALLLSLLALVVPLAPLAIGPARAANLQTTPLPETSVSSPARSAPERPAPCRSVAVGELAAALEAVSEGDALCLESGRHVGPVVVARRVTLWGPKDAVIASSGEGTTVRMDADGAALLGLTVDGSGGRFDTLDAAVHVGADDCRVEGVRVQGAVFGILVEKARRAILRGCEVHGSGRGPLGLRGDGIRLWETRDSLVEGNHVRGSRDVVVWYSPGNRLAGNLVENSRYGTHFMYSSDNVVEDNRYVGNVVGVFIMYSRNIRLERNVLALSKGSAGIGVGVKESGNIVVRNNLLARNTTGIYLDTSPLNLGDSNVFEENRVSACDTAVLFHSSETRNAFRRNVLDGNGAQARVDGGGNALGVEWKENSFDDYVGYDFNEDGVGDVPYELADFSGDLQAKHPSLAFFHGSATLALLDAVSHAFPLLRPRTLLVDPAPRMDLVVEVPGDAH